MASSLIISIINPFGGKDSELVGTVMSAGFFCGCVASFAVVAVLLNPYKMNPNMNKMEEAEVSPVFSVIAGRGRASEQGGAVMAKFVFSVVSL